MSADSQPIDPARFAQALEALPLDALHAKAAELRNSRAHLRSSNAQMVPFADAGDVDCREAMFENLGVIARLNQRLALLRAEVVDRRAMPWPEDPDDAAAGSSGPGGEGRPEVNGSGPPVAEVASQAQPRRLTDEELAREMARRLDGDGDGAEDGEGGVYL